MGLIYGIAAIGIYLTFRILDFPDLTCDGSFVLGAAVSAMALKVGVNPFLALILSTLLGAASGLITGILHVHAKVSNLLSGILTAFMLYSLNLRIMGGAPNISLTQEKTFLNAFGEEKIIFILILIGFCVWGLISYILSTDFGLSLRGVGQNKKLALVSGVNISMVTIIGLALSNALVGLSGGVFCQYQGFADISQGVGTIVIGLAGIIIGEKFFPLRSIGLSILACIVGSILYRLVVALALHSEWLGLETADLNLITGIIVVMIMLIPPLKLKRAQ
jgi:putative tryptophan/tyrosine transport system permease protein